MRGGLAGSTRRSRARFGMGYHRSPRIGAIQILDDIAWPDRAKPASSHGTIFFNALPQQRGAAPSPAPSGGRTCTTRASVQPHRQGCPRPALKKLGVSHDLMTTRVKHRSPRLDDERLGSTSSGAVSSPASTYSLAGVRDADVLGVWSPDAKNAASAAALARSLDVGDAKRVALHRRHGRRPAIDAIWSAARTTPASRTSRRSSTAIDRGRGTLQGIACEKPLARNVAEAKRVRELVSARRVQRATSRTSSSRRTSRRAARCSGRAAPRRPDVRISRAPPRSTAVRTCRGSGRATCRAAACSTT